MDELKEREIEVPRLPPYTLVFNSIIQDERLRLPVRAVLILMLSVPPGWDYSIRGMARIAGVNKDTMAKMVRELEEAGYVRRKERPREDDGRYLRGSSFEVLLPGIRLLPDAPSPCPKISDMVRSPCPNFSDPEKPDEINKQEINTIPPKAPQRGRRRQNKTQPDWMPERFLKLWDYYPRHEKKQAAIRAWDMLRPGNELVDTMARALVQQMRSQAWQEGIGIPYLSTWLDGARWEDVPYQRPAREVVDGGWLPDPEVL